LKVLEDLVTRSGYQSVTTTNSDEALRYALDRKFAVVIADHNMPDMLGADLLHRFAQIQPSSSRILITGIKSLDVVTAAVNSGEIFRFVTKPWISAEMMATLHNAVQRHELIETNRSLERTTLDLNQKLSEANTRLEKQLRELEAGKRELDFSHEALKTNFSRSLELCQRILTTFNPLLGEQAKAALKIAQIMAETHYFDEEQKHVLEVSARLYDIGLSAIPSGFMMAVQNDLEDSPPEMKTIFQNHTIHGQTLASFVDLLKPVGDTIRAHHERFDGKGFPDGLAGEMIPWPARCLAVVVYYVTCGLPHEQAVDRISTPMPRGSFCVVPRRRRCRGSCARSWSMNSISACSSPAAFTARPAFCSSRRDTTSTKARLKKSGTTTQVPRSSVSCSFIAETLSSLKVTRRG
jgi:response regulator RpfG family c-di-GMP phosphodiesterase